MGVIAETINHTSEPMGTIAETINHTSEPIDTIAETQVTNEYLNPTGIVAETRVNIFHTDERMRVNVSNGLRSKEFAN